MIFTFLWFRFSSHVLFNLVSLPGSRELLILRLFLYFLLSAVFQNRKTLIAKAEQHGGRLQRQMISSIVSVRTPERLTAASASFMNCEREAQVAGGSGLSQWYQSSSLFLLLLDRSSSCCGKIKPTVTNEVNFSPESTGLLSAELHPSRDGRQWDKQDGERCFSCCVTGMTNDGRVDAQRIHTLILTAHKHAVCFLLLQR